MGYNEFKLSDERCYICGSYVKRDFSNYIPKYFCEICSPVKADSFHSIRNLVDFLTNEAKKQIYENGLVNVENIDVLSFLADIGELVHSHPYYKNFPRHLSNIIILLSGRRRDYIAKRYIFEISRMIPGYSTKKHIPTKRMYNIHKFLVETGVVKEKPISDDKITFVPTELTKSVFDSIQTISYVEKEIPRRVSASIVGYVYIEGMKLTIDWLYNGGEGEPKGIFRLYIIDSKGNINIPRTVNAPTVFMLQLLATDLTQFYSNEVMSWLQHLRYRERAIFINWLSRVIPNTNRFVDPVMIGEGNYLFKINPNYIRMRDRYRFYARER